MIGSKVGMNQSFIEGRRIPVTKIVVGPCVVTQVKKQEKDGYWAIQLGFGSRKAKHTSKALQGHFKEIQSSKIKNQNEKTKTTNYPRHLREIRLEKEPDFKVGDVINVSDVFKRGDIIAVTGVSKGKGFAGGVKRWGFAGGSRTHGQSDRERAPGSIGQGTTPGRVLKGKKMAGKMGDEQVTVKNLQIVAVNHDVNEIEISGPVPGRPEGLLIIRKIAEGKLEGIQEVQAQVVEGEGGEEAGEGAESSEKPQEVKEEQANG